MKECWRWFGPLDQIPLAEVAQTGASGVVTALHDIPYGEVWSVQDIETRKTQIEGNRSLGLTWSVVESLPVHDDIKRGEGDLARLFANYRQSLANLAECGVRTVCYNFMPVIDWLRTDHAAPVRGGGRALVFCEPVMAGFEIGILGRHAAYEDYAPEVIDAGLSWVETASDDQKSTLLACLMAGLPGAYDRYSVEALKAELARYAGFTRDDLRASFARFLAEVVPTADDLGIALCVHPDDPPRPVFGLPRVVSTAEDIDWILAQQDAWANGLTFCSGALGARQGNDLTDMAQRFAARTHFLHLRNVTKSPDGSFHEADHFGGDADMVSILRVWLAEEARRRGEGRADWQLPFRPDHGHELGPDLSRQAHPGYPYVGRLRGLAELRGAIAALTGSAPR
ncbi:mannonate dehydratase [Shimia biformata]|uniref:mannonate dehydratase n=1 Tax=Shimia biformata TaxID=1294299 RepID=UPI00194F6BBE|nr:mannonate dehydratase [Shimia biformata]